MPAGGILTFNDVVEAGQQGIRFRQQQQEHQRQQQELQRQDQQRAVWEAANKEAAGVIEQSRAEWALNGAQGEYRPSDSTLMRAAEARGRALAKAGDWDGFMKNEVAVQGQRLRVRGAALQQYEQDGDVDRLARAIYPTIFDGKQITGSQLVKGGQGSLKGAPSGPDRWRFTFDDGSTTMVEADKLVSGLKRMLVDPVEAAKQEIALNFERAKRDITTEGQIRVERERGDQARQTAAVRTEGQLAVQEVRNEGAQERADTRVAGQIRVAELRGAGGGRGGGAGGAINKVQSRFTNDRGEVILVMRDGTHQALIGDDGKPVKSLDYEKLVGSVARDVARSPEGIGNTPAQNRDAAKKTLGSEAKPGSPSGPGAKDYRSLWSK